MIIDAYCCDINTTVGNYSVYRTEFRAKNQTKTVFAKNKGTTCYSVKNKFSNCEVVINPQKSDFYDNRLCLHLYNDEKLIIHEVYISISYFISKLLPYCTGNKINTDLAYVPNHGIMLANSPEYTKWETAYLKEYTESGDRRKGSGLFNGKRIANKPEEMYYASSTLIQYIGRYTVPEDITKYVPNGKFNTRGGYNVDLIKAGTYYAYAERSQYSFEIKLTASPRKLSAVSDLIESASPSIKNYSIAQLKPFFYDCFVFGFGRRKVYGNPPKHEDIIPYITTTNSPFRLRMYDVKFDIMTQHIRAK